MSERSPQQGDADDGARIGRRGFIGAGLAGAGVALIGPAGAASARSVPAASQGGVGLRGAPLAAASAGTAITQMPLRAAYPHLPAIPQDPAGMLETLGKLSIRAEQVTQAKQSLTRELTIRGVTRTAYAFLFGETATTAGSDAGAALAKLLQEHPDRVSPDVYERSLRAQSQDQLAASTSMTSKPVALVDPEQFSISWTTVPDVYRSGLPSLPRWASSLTDADSATEQFWPMIAEHGLAFNLILPQRVTRATAESLRRKLNGGWTHELQMASAAGNLYVIDMSRFEALQPHSVSGAPRFTPSTVTLLTHNPHTKALIPIAVLVSGYRGRGRKLFTRATATDGAWLYALQAAKASLTVFGIWLGHVYHWHLVTAAMQMTMLNALPNAHPVYQLLAPQSKYVIAFDGILLALWSRIAPPTPLADATQFLSLANDYAAGRSYFDDDPKTTLTRLGLREADFTVATPWDQYPVVQRLLAVWDLVETYVESCVHATYRTDVSVAGDHDLQTWIASSSASSGGNIRGLPRMNSRTALQRVLTSLLYRVTVHGVARLSSTSNPALTFVANFPHCLQRTNIPDPHAPLNTRSLLTYLPNMATIGETASFYFTFAFSTPYEPFIPLGGVATELFFPGGPGDLRNRALIELRRGVVAFMDDYQPDAPQRFQWPRNIET